jgi:hypothetical protein
MKDASWFHLKLNILLFTCPLIVIGQQLVCPPAQYYRPCSCNSWGDDAAWLFCFNLDLNDTKTSQILSAFISNQSGISPLGAVTLNNNKLTKVPDEIKFFPRLVYVNLAGNNIRTIQRGAFNFTSTADHVLLFENEISFIEPGAFQGIYYS